jgi:hypothetical protein
VALNECATRLHKVVNNHYVTALRLTLLHTHSHTTAQSVTCQACWPDVDKQTGRCKALSHTYNRTQRCAAQLSLLRCCLTLTPSDTSPSHLKDRAAMCLPNTSKGKRRTLLHQQGSLPHLQLNTALCFILILVQITALC